MAVYVRWLRPLWEQAWSPTTHRPARSSANVDNRAPWASAMTFMSNGFWLPPPAVLSAVVDSWSESVRDFLVLPPWQWTPDKVQQYTIANSLDTTRLISGAVYEVSIPGN